MNILRILKRSLIVNCQLSIVNCLLLTACSPLELCEEPVHPHMAEIRVKFNWPAGVETAADRPEYMHIVATRPYNTWRNHGISETSALTEPWNKAWNGLHPADFVFPMDPENMSNPGESLTPEEPDTPEEPETPTDPENPDTPDEPETRNAAFDYLRNPFEPYLDPTTRNKFYLHNGDYHLIAVNHLDMMTIDSLQEYIDRPEMMIDSLYLRQIKMKREDMPDELFLTEIEDFNQGYSYVYPFTTPVYRAIELYRRVDTGDNRLIEFTPDSLSRPVRVRFKVFVTGNEAEDIRVEDIALTRVVTEISGICNRTNLYHKFVDVDSLARTYFSVELGKDSQPVSASYEVDGEMRQGLLYNCEGRFNILGLVYNRSSISMVGPGIMHFAVVATIRYTQPNGVVRDKMRVFYAGANPRQKFVDANMLRKDLDGRYYLNGCSEVLIELDNPILMDGTKIKYNGDDVFWWKAGENIDVDI